MFFNSKSFKTLEAGVQMAWARQQLHGQNLANIETPGYKSKNLDFSAALKAATQSGTVPDTIHAKVVTDDATSILQDGNNVDLEKENLALYKTYTQYSLLLDKVKGEFDQYSAVLNNNMK
ncbi:MAG: flagellar basal body rod protein FlgB [Ruthenibacterium sp.]